MAHTFFCPQCGKRFDREEDLAGKKARCKDCQHVFVIPFVSLQPIRPGAPVKRKPRRRSGNEFAWLGQVTVGGIILQAILLLFFGSFTYAELPAAAAIAYGSLCAVCIGLMVVGTLVNYIVPFLESVTHGLLYMFVPRARRRSPA